MDKLTKDETCITGNIIIRNGEAAFDDNVKRIEYLTNNVLTKLAKDDSGWYTLYYDDQHNSYWERWYPNGEMHGGGPPELRKITDLARIKKVYDLDA